MTFLSSTAQYYIAVVHRAEGNISPYSHLLDWGVQYGYITVQYRGTKLSCYPSTKMSVWRVLKINHVDVDDVQLYLAHINNVHKMLNVLCVRTFYCAKPMGVDYGQNGPMALKY